MTNKDIAKIFFEMAAFFDMDSVPFKPRAYEAAALAIEGLAEEVSGIYAKGGIEALMNIPGVGKGIAEHIKDILASGSFKEYRDFKKKYPIDVLELTAIEGVGPKMVKALWDALGIRTAAELEKAARAGKVAKLPRFGKKSEERIVKGVEFQKKSGGRRILGFVLPELRSLEKMIRSFPEVKEANVGGSARRMKETIGDIDIVASSARPKIVMERFLKLPFIAHAYAKGEAKTLVRFKNGLDADIRVVPPGSWGAALLYFTGSKEHNIALREIAIKKGWKLNEYGIFKNADERGQEKRKRARRGELIAGKTEEDVYGALGLRYIEPELRENAGEIEAAQEDRLPKLIEYGALRGDLQVQTDWTDGAHSIEEMAKAARDAGLEYIAITDHTKSLAMTGGADEKKLLRQTEEIEKINSKFKNQKSKFRILKGAEVNIRKDGTLDIADAALAKLDVVGAAVHSHFALSRAEQTKRVIRAMENPHVDIIFHLTGRLIGKREPIDVDVDEVIRAAKRTRTALEIDAYPERLDIKDEYIRKCVEAGVKMSIDSDAHSVEHFKYLELGIGQARRGWAEKKDIINAWPAEKMLAMLK